MQTSKPYDDIVRENELLHSRLEEAQELLTAIRTGSIDALVVDGPNGEQVYTLEGADHVYRIFVETMNEGAVTLAADGTIAYCNKRLADLLGKPLEEMFRRRFADFVTSANRAEFEALLKQADEAGVRGELVLEHPDSEAIPVRVSARRLAQQYGNSVCLVVTDLRGQKLQDALRESEERLAVELADTKLLQTISAESIHEENIEALYEKILDAVVAIMHSEYASMQVLFPKHGSGGELRLLAFRGFNPEAARFWKCVCADSKSTCGAALRSGKRIVVPNIEKCDFMAGTEDLTTYLQTGIHAVQSTPLVSRAGKMVGMISTHWRDPYSPSENDLHLLDILARQAADLMERKQAEDKLHQLNETLEARVKERTSDLVASQKQLRALTAELNRTEQRLCKRLATELHDYLAQLLVFGRLKIGSARSRLAGADPLMISLIGEIDEIFTQSITYTRTLMAELNPPALQLGLPAALKWLGEQMVKYGLTVEFYTSQDQVPLPDDQVILLYQSVRELLINVVKHAHTSHATLSIAMNGTDELHIVVQDEGKGFDPAFLGIKPVDEHFGILNVRERMKALGGWCQTDSAPGRGTTITLGMPLRLAINATVVHAGASVSKERVLPAENSSVVHRVLLVEDHAMVRQGLRAILEGFEDVLVIGEATNGEEAVSLVAEVMPDVILMDVNMPKMDGIEATKQITAAHPSAIVVGLSVDNSPPVIEAMKEAGAATFVTKDAAAEQLHHAIRHCCHQHNHPVPRPITSEFWSGPS